MINDRQQVTDDLSTPHPETAQRGPRTRAHPTGGFRANCAAPSRAWTKTISAPACSAVPIGCAPATSPIRSKPPSPAICKSWASRSRTRRAPWAMRSTPPQEAALNRAMDDLSRLRDQLGSLGGKPGSQPGQGQARSARPRPRRTTVPTRPARSQRPARSAGQWTRRPARCSRRRQAGGIRRVQVGNRRPVRVGDPAMQPRRLGRPVNTGNTRSGSGCTRPYQGPNPADTQREIDQGLNVLNQVRAAVQDSPEARQELQTLIDEMRTSRSPAVSPAIPRWSSRCISSSSAAWTRSNYSCAASSMKTRAARSATPTRSKVPAGYQASVAEYYRKLSTTH